MGDSTADSQQDGESEVQISLEALGRIFHRFLSEARKDAAMQIRPLEQSVATHERLINDYKERIAALELWRGLYDIKDKDIENLKNHLTFLEENFAKAPLAEARPTTREDRRRPLATQVVPVPPQSTA